MSANNGTVGILGNQAFVGAADTLHATSDASHQNTRYSDMDLAAGRRSNGNASLNPTSNITAQMSVKDSAEALIVTSIGEISMK